MNELHNNIRYETDIMFVEMAIARQTYGFIYNLTSTGYTNIDHVVIKADEL